MEPEKTNDLIAVVGAGLVGSGWAIVFARAGFDVTLFDSVPGAAERAYDLIGQRLQDLFEATLVTEPTKIHARIRMVKDHGDNVMHYCRDADGWAATSTRRSFRLKQKIRGNLQESAK